MKKPFDSVLILGCGYVGLHLARALIGRGVRVIGTTRDPLRADALRACGVEAVVASSPLEVPAGLLSEAEAVVDSIPLGRASQGLVALQPRWVPQLARRLGAVRWVGYLSSTGIYGDAGGAWVDEATPPDPTSARGRARIEAENAWLDSGLPVEVFRLAGIYGPGRNILGRLLAGDYPVVRFRPDHWSNRVHVTDIVRALIAAMERPKPARIVNVADDEPLPHADYVREVARMIGAPPPQELTPDEAERRLGVQLVDFFRDNKRVSNRRLHEQLLPELSYPSFRDAVPELLAEHRRR